MIFKANDTIIWVKNFILDIDGSRPEDGNIEFTLGSMIPGEFGTITAATAASPIVITSTAHGLNNSDEIVIANCAGNLAANGEHVVANKTTNTFELSGTRGTTALKLPALEADYPQWFKIVGGLKNKPIDFVSIARGYAGEDVDASTDLIPERDYFLIVRILNYGYESQGVQRCKVRKLGSVT